MQQVLGRPNPRSCEQADPHAPGLVFWVRQTAVLVPQPAPMHPLVRSCPSKIAPSVRGRIGDQERGGECNGGSEQQFTVNAGTVLKRREEFKELERRWNGKNSEQQHATGGRTTGNRR